MEAAAASLPKSTTFATKSALTGPAARGYKRRLCAEQRTSRVGHVYWSSALKLANEFGDVSPPSIECVLAFGKEIMPLVDRCDT